MPELHSMDIPCHEKVQTYISQVGEDKTSAWTRKIGGINTQW